MADRRRDDMNTGPADQMEEKTRDSMVRQLRQNLARCRRVIVDETMDLKTRERWTQLYNNTSQVLNQVLRDRQMRDWEKRLQLIEQHRKTGKSPDSDETVHTNSDTTNRPQ